MEQKTILCVDDEPLILETLKLALLKKGFRVLTAQSGEEGLRLLEIHSVEMVISDYRMPGMNGMEFLFKVQGRYPEKILCILTGVFQEDFSEEEIKQMGIHHFFKKPFDLDQLAVIQKELGI